MRRRYHPGTMRPRAGRLPDVTEPARRPLIAESGVLSAFLRGASLADFPLDDGLRRSRRKPAIVFILGCVLVIAAMWLLTRLTRDVQFDPPRLSNSVWSARVGAEPRLYFVTEEQRGERGYFDIELLHSYMASYSVFELHALNARTGAAVAKVKLARIDTGTPDARKYQVNVTTISEEPRILGPHDAMLWLWNGGLEGRRLDSLEAVWTAARLKEVNAEFGALLPDEPKYFKVLAVMGGLLFRGRDSRFFQIDAADGAIRPVDEARLAAASREYVKTADSAFTSPRSEGDSLRSTAPSALMWDTLTEGSTWYALLTTEQRATLTSRPGYGWHPSGEVARSLFRGQFELEYRQALGENHILLDLDSVTAVGDERFIMGGFLRRPNGDNVWPVEAGKSYLVLHRQALGEQSPWLLTRLDLDGTERWTTSIGLPDIQQISEGGGTVVIVGLPDSSQATARKPDVLVFIDELTGERRMLNVVTGELTSGGA